MRDYRLYLKDILSAMDSIEAFVKGMSFEEFGSDDKTSSAVIQKFEIIGEATKNIPVIIFTAKEYSEGKTLAEKKGAVDFIAKPFELDDLVEIIGKYTG